MSKIAIITDTHLGFKHGDEFFLQNHKTFFENVFWPFIDKNKIHDILFLGDLVDDRVGIKHKTLYEINKFFVEPLLARGIQLYAIPGNHDLAYKNTNDISAVDLLLKDLIGVTVVNTPSVINIGGEDIALVPWISPQNQEECIKFIETTTAKTIAGHFDIVGCVLAPGILSEHGLEQKAFSRFDRAWSGHFHTSGQYGNIKYLGTPYEMSFADVCDRKGFHTWDGKNLVHIPNPKKVFHVIEYDDSINDYTDLIPATLKDCIVRLKIKKVATPLTLDTFITRLNAICYKVYIVDDTQKEDLTGAVLEASSIVKDTKTLIKDYVASLEGDVDKEAILGILLNVYSDAVTAMNVSNEI